MLFLSKSPRDPVVALSSCPPHAILADFDRFERCSTWCFEGASIKSPFLSPNLYKTHLCFVYSNSSCEIFLFLTSHAGLSGPLAI